MGDFVFPALLAAPFLSVKLHAFFLQFTAVLQQLAHVVSNADVKSPSLFRADGFSAGSFLDLTRVAYLNEEMWSSLFMCNKEALLYELNNVINSLAEYRDAMVNDDINTLRELLKVGRERKEKSMEFYGQERR